MPKTAEINVQCVKSNYISNSIHHSRFQKLEKTLNDLILKELNSKNSIFIKISPYIVKKIAMFMSGLALRPAAIGIAGETASGKSTIVHDAIEIIDKFCQEFLLKPAVTRINTDDYYYDRSEEVKKAGSFAEFIKTYDLDSPKAIELSLMKKHIQILLNRNEVFLPKYDMSGTAKRFEYHTLAQPSPIIIAEGLYTLINEVSDIFDFTIYVEIDKKTQKTRFFERVNQRGLGNSADKIFKNATQKALIYVKPCAENADIILNGAVSRDKYQSFMSSLLNLLESTYYNFMI